MEAEKAPGSGYSGAKTRRGEAGGSTSLQEELPGVGDQEGSHCGWSPKGQESLFNFVGNRGNLSSFGHRVDTEWSRTHRVTP